MTAQMKHYIFGVIAGLIVLSLAGWVGFIIVFIGAALWYMALRKGAQDIRAYLFLSALDEGRTVAEANEFAELISNKGLAQVALGAELYADQRHGGSVSAMITAAKNAGFRG